MKKSIILLRVSTIQQDLDQQKADLVEYSKQLGYDDYTFIADKESGIKLSEEERLGLSKLKELVKNDDTYKGVIVYEISRLARTQSVLYSMKEWLQNNKVNLHIYDKQYTLIKDNGDIDGETELLFSMYAYFASAEMKTKKMRFARGKKKMKEEGKFSGGTILYGYTWDINTKEIIPLKEEKDIVIEIFNKYINSDLTIHQIAKEYLELGTFPKRKNINTVSRRIADILQHKGYIGECDDNSLHYPPIIPKEYHLKAQEKLSKAKKFDRGSTNIYYCKSLLKSSTSGYAMRPNITNYSYECREGEYINIKIDVLDGLLWKLSSFIYYPLLVIKADSNKVEEIKEQIEVNCNKITNLNNNINSLNEELSRLNSLYVKGRIKEDAYERDYNNILQEIDSTNKRIKELDMLTQSLNNTLLQVEETKSVNINQIADITDHQRRIEIIKESIHKVFVSKVDRETRGVHIISKSGLEGDFIIHNRTRKVWEVIKGKEVEIKVEPININIRK